MKRALIALCLFLLTASTSSAAGDPIRIGILGQFTGPFAIAGAQFRQGVDAWVAQNGTNPGGRPIEILYRDIGGANPANARRLAEELITHDKVSILGGFYLSPEATAVASLVTEAKIPTVLFEAGSAPVVTLSPYFVRTGNSIAQGAQTQAMWAYKHGKRKAYLIVSDYAPGYDVEAAFKDRFTSLGGTIVGDDRAPLSTVDYAPFAARAADTKADLVVTFIPTGAPAISLLKALTAQGVSQKVVVIGQAEADDPDLGQYDDTILGFYSSLHYALGINNDANRKFKAAIQSKYPGAIPSFLMVGAWDGMRVIYHMIEAQNGKPFDPDVAISSVLGYSFDSPRGRVTINKETHDINQPYFIRRVEKVNGHLQNALIETFPPVTDTTHNTAAK